MRKIDSLTGVRIFAALAVFASHLPKPGGLPTPFAPSWKRATLG